MALIIGGLPQRCAAQFRCLLKSQQLLSSRSSGFHVAIARHSDKKSDELNDKSEHNNQSELKEIDIVTSKKESQFPSVIKDTETHIYVGKRVPPDTSPGRSQLKEIPDLRNHPVDNREIPRQFKENEDHSSLVIRANAIFIEASEGVKNRTTFLKAVELFNKKERVYKRGHVEFIYEAIKKLDEYSVAKDLEVYKALAHIFPKGPFLPKTKWQIMFMPYPKQQHCAIDIMCAMEANVVMPDAEFGKILESVFYHQSFAYQKYQRMMYWMPKFKYANPYRLPDVLPATEEEWAAHVLKRMSVDVNSEVTIWQTEDLDDKATEKTFIASSQSIKQRELLENHPTDQPLRVEGGFTIWTGGNIFTYFTLKVDACNVQHLQDSDIDDVDDLLSWSNMNIFGGETAHKEENTEEVVKRLEYSVHEQQDETIFAMCMTGTGSKDSLVQWIRCLQKTNPTLESTPVLFTLKSPIDDSLVIDDSGSKTPVASS